MTIDIDFRNILQLIKFFFCIASLVMIFLIARKGIAHWRYFVLPITVLVQWVVFYGYVVILTPSPSVDVTLWANIITFQAIVGFFLLLVLVYREYK